MKWSELKLLFFHQTGIVKTSRDTLFVHPLPAHLAKHVTSSEDATPHLVHRRSVKEDVISLKNDVMHMVKEGNEAFFFLTLMNIVFPFDPLHLNISIYSLLTDHLILY